MDLLRIQLMVELGIKKEIEYQVGRRETFIHVSVAGEGQESSFKLILKFTKVF